MSEYVEARNQTSDEIVVIWALNQGNPGFYIQGMTPKPFWCSIARFKRLRQVLNDTHHRLTRTHWGRSWGSLKDVPPIRGISVDEE